MDDGGDVLLLMAIRTEITLRLQNSPGAVSRVCQILADEHVNILAMQLEATGVMRLVVDNHVRAAGALRDRHHQVDLDDVLYTMLSNVPGVLGRVTSLLASGGVNIEYLYATANEGQPQATAVIGVPDAQRASAASGI